jgi:hypothetical protein
VGVEEAVMQIRMLLAKDLQRTKKLITGFDKPTCVLLIKKMAMCAWRKLAYSSGCFWQKTCSTAVIAIPT